MHIFSILRLLLDFFIFNPYFHFERWKKKRIPSFRIRYLLPTAKRRRNFKGAPLRVLLRTPKTMVYWGLFSILRVRQFASRWKRLPTKWDRDFAGKHKKAEWRNECEWTKEWMSSCRTPSYFYVFSHFFLRVALSFTKVCVYTASDRKQLDDNFQTRIEKNRSNEMIIISIYLYI